MHSALRPFPLGQGGWALYGNFVRDQHEKVLPLSAGKGDCQSEETTTVATWPHRRSSRAIRPRLLLQSLHTVRIMVRDGAGVRARVRVGAGVGVGPDKCAPPRLRAARAGGTRVLPPSAPRLNGARVRVRVEAGVGVGPDKCAPPRLRAARAGGTRVPPPSAPRLNGVRVGVRVWG